MNTFKSDVAIGTADDIGKRLRDMFEAAKNESVQARGARKAYETAEESVAKLYAFVDKQMDDGEFTPEQRAAAKRTLELACGAIRSLHERADVIVHQADGRVMAMKSAVEVTGKIRMQHVSERDEIIARAHKPAPANGEMIPQSEVPPVDRFGGRVGRRIQRSEIPLGQPKEEPETSEDELVAAEGDTLSVEELADLPIQDLRDRAKALGVKASGKKKEIAKRIASVR